MQVVFASKNNPEQFSQDPLGLFCECQKRQRLRRKDETLEKTVTKAQNTQAHVNKLRGWPNATSANYNHAIFFECKKEGLLFPKIQTGKVLRKIWYFVFIFAFQRFAYIS